MRSDGISGVVKHMRWILIHDAHPTGDESVSSEDSWPTQCPTVSSHKNWHTNPAI